MDNQSTPMSHIIESSDGSLSIKIPLTPKVRSGRKIITLPGSTDSDYRPWDSQPTPLQLALARAYEWEQKLNSGVYGSIKELANKEGVDNSYVSRILNLNILAPDIIQAILDEKVPDTLTIQELGADTPMGWEEQREKFGLCQQE
ncbi:LacI family transcriptional regulator [Agarilytica rhodophyticola]|uniref:LacI family transcriptional regulator n=1 Tax=Agarilytica rhodophyticola TaxID=1737490 RepID=UPI000CD95BFE|nr:LacI family transcriptional regulator [Agarilytica rhodophyticola]